MLAAFPNLPTERQFERFVGTIFFNFEISSYLLVCRIFTSQVQLHKFEVAQLANLCPESAEEGKALIPRSFSCKQMRVLILFLDFSLESKMEDDELDDILKSLSAKKTY